MKNLTKILLSIYVSIMMIAVACKKENTVSPEVCKVSSVKSYNEKTKTTETIQYEYNTDGKVGKMTYSPIVLANKNQAYEIISYSSTAIIFTLYDDKNKIISTSTYRLNSSGYVSEIMNFGKFTYEYDGQGFLVKELTEGFGQYITNYTYTDGNLTSIKELDDKGKTTYTITNEYYLDKPNPLKIDKSIGFWKNIVGQNLFGKSSRNLLKKSTENSGSTTIITDYTYSFDDKGNPIQLIEKASNGSNYTSDLTYLCK